MRQPTVVHQSNLRDLLCEVYSYGAARIRWTLAWFDTDKVTKNVWTHMEETWQEVCANEGDDSGWRLGKCGDRGDELTLVCLDPAKTAVEDSIFQPIPV
jgi:hypothetical protein